jgi:uncharacterized membrane protein
MSFAYLGIYWNNHHHMLQATARVTGLILWANMHLLFWLSLVPFVTAWAGDHPTLPIPVAVYGAVMFLAAIAYFILVQALLAIHAPESRLATAIGRDTKGKGSVLIYGIAVAGCFLSTAIGWGLYLAVALVWLVPDRRIEDRIAP